MKDILLALCGVGIGVALSQRRRVIIRPTIKIDSRVDREAMTQIVADAVRRGGAYRKAIRG